MAKHTIGVDISKAHLDAFRLEDAIPKRFENSPRGLRALARWLDTVPLARVVFEATGPVHLPQKGKDLQCFTGVGGSP